MEIYIDNKPTGQHQYFCPNCNKALQSKALLEDYSTCGNCGAPLDWSDRIAWGKIAGMNKTAKIEPFIEDVKKAYEEFKAKGEIQ